MSDMILGQVQETAVAFVGLQSPEMLQIEIDLQKKGYENNISAIVAGKTGIDDKMDSTIACGIDEKKQLMKQSIGGMVGSGLAMGAGIVGLGGSAYSASQASTAKTRLNNLDQLEKQLNSITPNDIALNRSAANSYGDINFYPEEEFDTAKFLNGPAEGKGVLFDVDQSKPNYFKSAAVNIAELNKTVEAQNNIAELRRSFQSDLDSAKKNSMLFPEQSQVFGRAASGLSESAGNMAGSFEKVALAKDQIKQQSADFAMQFAKSMQDTMNQNIETARRMADAIIQNEQTVSSSQRV